MYFLALSPAPTSICGCSYNFVIKVNGEGLIIFGKNYYFG
jgi:hypothetical protein